MYTLYVNNGSRHSFSVSGCVASVEFKVTAANAVGAGQHSMEALDTRWRRYAVWGPLASRSPWNPDWGGSSHWYKHTTLIMLLLLTDPGREERSSRQLSLGVLFWPAC